MRIDINKLRAKHRNYSEPVHVLSVDLELRIFCWDYMGEEIQDTFDYVEYWEVDEG